ncbi:T9SS type A sorting domain-containing protein [Hymenobacter sp. CRA2]|uniref:T9SS type A sorting domain-containing protein n=1 Tax=Hymenobacter sp. CRA2 TaxID=1955620 RepID=UPI00098E928B|nr:T9SS type A sorting domain-containing protein [Hymenobacter sp. CRA2]OON69734.1 hypothetical protein B0919_07345 [Hymenobacter sp. CRA2]
MAHILRFIRPLTWLLLFSGSTLQLSAQNAGWEQSYGTSAPETCTQTLRQPDGSYLLIGESGSYAARRLYLLLTTAHGRQLWERHVAIPGLSGFVLRKATQNNAGDLLLALYTEGIEGQTNYLVQTSATGVTRWMRTFPPTADLRWAQDLAPSPNGGFIVGMNSLTGAALLYLAADGTQLRQQPINASLATDRTWIEKIFPVPGGMLLSVRTGIQSAGPQAKLVFYSYEGTRGPETTLPNVDPAYGLVPLGGNDYLALGQKVHRFTLGQNTVQWTSQLSAEQGIFMARYGVLTPTGSCLLYGSSILGSHVARLHLLLLDVTTGLLQEPSSSGNQAVVTLCAGLHLGLGGLFAEPGTGAYVVTGSRESGAETEEVFMRGGSLADLAAPVPATMQAWPNPAADADELHVQGSVAASGPLALYDTQGRQVKSWPAASTGAARLSLRGVPAGVYTLAGTDGKGRPARIRIFKR